MMYVTFLACERKLAEAPNDQNLVTSCHWWPVASTNYSESIHYIIGIPGAIPILAHMSIPAPHFLLLERSWNTVHFDVK